LLTYNGYSSLFVSPKYPQGATWARQKARELPHHGPTSTHISVTIVTPWNRRIATASIQHSFLLGILTIGSLERLFRIVGTTAKANCTCTVQ
jgi:hypothetical protein